jgi:hypothetical protein
MTGQAVASDQRDEFLDEIVAAPVPVHVISQNQNGLIDRSGRLVRALRRQRLKDVDHAHDLRQ